ncbi:hypothetical protein VTJ04DRAFT_4914 [Mycothermus thermophilus]|uniref:uncharacterized protein n=1 Tax=Humicola insolens TaxID=85995 RepID=UPI0037446264
MVGGKKVLLSIAVLSGLCFDNVLGGHIKRQDGAGASSQEEVVSPIAPGEPGSTAGGAGGEGSSSEPSSPTSPSTTTTTTTQRVPPVIPTGGPIVLQATSSVNVAGGTSSQYVVPAVWGADGSLTTDTNAPTRTVAPTVPTVAPGTGTSRVPPPFEIPSTSETVRAPTTRAGPPVVPTAGNGGGGGNIVVSFDFGNPGGSTDDGQSQATSITFVGGGGNQQYSPDQTPSSTAAEPSESTAPPGDENGSGGNEPQNNPPAPPRPRPSNTKPPTLPTNPVTVDLTETIDLGFPSTTPTTFVTSTLPANETFTYLPSQTVSYCQESDLVAPTYWSVVYTSTITWYGHPEDYTPPFPPLSLPGPTASCVIPPEPPRLTICASTGTDAKYRTCMTTTSSFSYGVQTSWQPVFLTTTDKNPAVVFTTINTPRYGVSQAPQSQADHASPTPDPTGQNQDPPSYDSSSRGPQAITTPAAQPPVTTPITVAVQPTAVVINGRTIYDNPGQPTQTVVVDGQTFTIDPTRVVGGGATVDRPAATGGVNLPTPTSTSLDGVPITVSSSTIVIGTSTVKLPPPQANQPGTTTIVVSSRTFTVGPSTIAGPSQTLTLPTYPRPTEVVTAGGDLITAIGSTVIVVRSTTYTYNVPGAAVTTVTVDDGVVLTLGPGGVTASDGQVLTVGGTHAASPTETQYAVVGGATLTKIGASVVVVAGTTWTLGTDPAATATTTVDVGGTKVTIGPSVVQVGTMTLALPFGPTTVIMPGATPSSGAKATAGSNGDGEEGGEEEGEEDAAGSVRPWLLGVVSGAVIAVVLSGGMI